jgi:hypothetical protein
LRPVRSYTLMEHLLIEMTALRDSAARSAAGQKPEPGDVASASKKILTVVKTFLYGCQDFCPALSWTALTWGGRPYDAGGPNSRRRRGDVL